MNKLIEIKPYDPNWPHVFEKEAVLIQQALGGNCLAIHHIGSTAVPGLAAKPKIDIIAVVQDPLLARDQLEKIGIQYSGEYNIPLHYGFSKRGDIDLNLHVYEEFHPEIGLNLCFRDYLRNHTNKRDDYATLKEELIQDESSFTKGNSPFTNYTLRKGDFIREVLREAGFSGIRMLKCNDNTEWAAAKHFRDTYFFGLHGIDDPYTWTFNHKEHAHLVLYQGVEIVAYAHIQFWPDNRSAIHIIATDEDKRNQDFGSRFLALIEKWLRSLGIKSIHAESRQSSLRFYLKNGYCSMPFNDPEGHESDPNDVPVGKVIKVQGAFYTKTGKAFDVLKIGLFDVDEPKENEVQLQVITSSVNPSDVKIRSGLRGDLTYPYIIPHSDGAGIIQKLGNKVTNFKIGDRVWIYNAAWNRNIGTACEMINIDSSLIVPLYDNISFEIGACLAIPGLTAAAALLSLNCKFGDTVLITGGAGSVGMIAIQLAKLLGFKVITTVSSPNKSDIALQAGADHVINYTECDVASEVMCLTGGQGIDGLVDVDFGANISWSIEALKAHTTIATYASATIPNPELPFYKLMFKQITIKPIFVYILPNEIRTQSIELIQKACHKNLLSPLIHGIYPLNDIILAHEAVEKNQKIGQVLLKLRAER